MGDVITTWLNQLLIRQLRGGASFLVSLFNRIFFGAKPPDLGLIGAQKLSFRQVGALISNAGIAGFVAAVAFVLVFAFVVGRVIGGG